MYFGALFGYDARRSAGARASRLLDEVGIAAERRLQLRKFSKGMLQRVGIAQALLNDPDLVIFDEPMSGLDPLGRRDVRALILRLRDRGCTVFFSSHVLSDAEALCSRVAILARGRLVASGGLHEMLAFEASGWELVVGGMPAATARSVGAGIRRVVPIGERPVRARAAARSAARAAHGRADRGRRETDFAQSDSSDARGPLRRAGDLARRDERRVAASRRRRSRVMKATARDRGQRVPRVGSRQGALQPRAASRF